MATSTIEKVTNESGTNSNGDYCKMPDGTLMQWGTIEIPSNNTSVVVNFPISYVNQFSYASSMTAGNTYSNAVILTFASRQANSITIHRDANNANPEIVHWFTIGRWK